jgi:hypothetical protein
MVRSDTCHKHARVCGMEVSGTARDKVHTKPLRWGPSCTLWAMSSVQNKAQCEETKREYEGRSPC